MRLLYVSTDPGVPVLGHKGASVHVRELACALDQAGAEVFLTSPRVEDEGGRLARRLSLTRITPVLPLEHATAAGVRAAVAAQRDELERLCRELEIEAVYERYSLFSDAGVTAAHRLGLPHMLEINAPLRLEARRHRVLPHPRLASELEARVFASTDRCLCVSDEVAAYVRRRRSAAPAEVLPNAVDPSRFRAPTPRSDGGAITVGFAGGLRPWHGIETLLEACRIAFALEPRLRLELVGDGPMRGAVEAAPLPSRRVRILGAVDHTRALDTIRSWDIGVAPYNRQPGFYFSPLKVLEYMAAGICAVASDIGQLRSLLDEGRGVLVRPDDPKALAEAVVGLARSPIDRLEIAQRARAWVVAHRTWAGNTSIVLALVRETSEKAAA